jgi:hypothetical protein
MMSTPSSSKYEEETRKVPKIAAEIARRLLSAGRAQEASQTIEATEHRRRNSGWDWSDFEWEDARIDVLEALGRADDAAGELCAANVEQCGVVDPISVADQSVGHAAQIEQAVPVGVVTGQA